MACTLDENRHRGLVVDVRCELKGLADFGALGSSIGKISKNRIPAFTRHQGTRRSPSSRCSGRPWPRQALCPCSSSRESHRNGTSQDKAEKMKFTDADLKAAREGIDSGLKPDLVTIGCPHASLRGDKGCRRARVARRRPTCEFWVCTSRKPKEEADKLGYGRR